MTNLITAPFAWIMRMLYTLTGSYGWALILFALVIKLIMLPFQLKSKRSMVRMGRLSGKQAELQKKYANNQKKYQEELQKLYTEEGINPMGGCLWSFIPLIILIPLYPIVREPITMLMRVSTENYDKIRTLAESLGYAGSGNAAYEQISVAQFVTQHWADFQGKFDGLMKIDFTFLNLDLTVGPWDMVQNFEWSWACIGVILIPILSGALSFLLSKVTSSSNGQQTAQPGTKGLLIFMPLFSVYSGFMLPTSLNIYWIINSIFSIVQEATLGRYYNKKIQREEDERAAKREAARQLRMEEAKRQALEQKEHPKPQKKAPEKKAEKKQNPTNEAGRVGDRPYARGRSYVASRYDDK